MHERYVLELRDPEALSRSELTDLLGVLAEGEAVDVASAKQEIPRATRLVVVSMQEKPVGLGAIKSARPGYAEKIQKSSGHLFGVDTLELGYVAVAESEQGHSLSRAVVEKLLSSYSGDLFATTDDERMKRTLKRSGFAQHGNEWRGNRGTLSLWMRTTNTAKRMGGS